MPIRLQLILAPSILASPWSTSEAKQNRVFYAATIVVEASAQRAGRDPRRGSALARTRKTHRGVCGGWLTHLRITKPAAIVRFCERGL